MVFQLQFVSKRGEVYHLGRRVERTKNINWMQREMIIGKKHMKDIFTFVNGEYWILLFTGSYSIIYDEIQKI